MKVIVIGANGQLGSDITQVLLSEGLEVVEVNHDKLDIASFPDIEKLLQFEQPDVVINTAAFHQVDQCEENKEKAFLINAEAPGYISALSKKLGFRLIHFSTDYVFDGDKKTPYLESDACHPLNVYGASKYEGEKMILAENPDNIIIRVSGIYGHHPCRAKGGLNFVQLMLKLAREKGEVSVVNDEFVSPTNTMNVAEQTLVLLRTHLRGIVHATSEGACSWYDFAKEIFDYTHTPVKLSSRSSADAPPKTNRPKYSVLENSRLKEAGINIMPDWKTALHRYLDELPGEKA